MLKKIICIKNIGLFRDAKYVASDLDKAILIYAENGRGKTTLSRIFRSCVTNRPEILKQTLGTNKQIECKLLFRVGGSSSSTTTVSLSNGNWTGQYSNILIFDTDFIEKNVYSGTVVNPEHRQKLLEFALGEDAVKAKLDLENETNQVKESKNKVRSLTDSLNNYLGETSLIDFINLHQDPEIDQKISDCSKRLNDAESIDKLCQKPVPEILAYPNFDMEDFFYILWGSDFVVVKKAQAVARWAL